MNNRSVMMVFYDLPTETRADRRRYAEFRKELIRSGYIQMQKSLYMKLIRNTENNISEMRKVKSISPTQGTVQVLPLKLEDFLALKTVSGKGFDAATFTGDIVLL